MKRENLPRQIVLAWAQGKLAQAAQQWRDEECPVCHRRRGDHEKPCDEPTPF